MTDLKDRVSHDRMRVPRVRSSARLRNWLAPVTVVAAVIGVVAGVSLTAADDAGTGFTLPAETASSALSAPRDLPPYYVTLFQAYVDGGRRISTTAARPTAGL